MDLRGKWCQCAGALTPPVIANIVFSHMSNPIHYAQLRASQDVRFGDDHDLSTTPGPKSDQA